MGPNMYLYEKAREAYDQDLRCEAEKRRRLSHLPRHRWSMSRSTVGKLGELLLKLRTWLKQLKQSRSAEGVSPQGRSLHLRPVSFRADDLPRSLLRLYGELGVRETPA